MSGQNKKENNNLNISKKIEKVEISEKKKTFLISNIFSIIFFFLVALTIGIGSSMVAVNASNNSKIANTPAQILEISNEDVFLSEIRGLNNIYISVFGSNKLSLNSKIISECNIESKVEGFKNGIYVFNLTFLDNLCENGKFIISENNENVLDFSLNIKKEKDFLITLLNTSSENLEVMLEMFKERLLQINLNNASLSEVGNANLYSFFIDYIGYILDKRKEKYIVPVLGKPLPTKSSKLPNALRPYRNGYTDGIHHSRDIDTNFGEKVVALDEGIVMKIISDWKFEDLNKLKKTGELSEFDMNNNLDILRGNQIWLKTMKGDIVFYAHLEEVFEDLKVGDFVKRGEYLGTIGITGLPDPNYSDYHLDFSISPNPFTKISYTYEDYMSWPWLFKEKTEKYILENQANIFEVN